MHSNILEFGLLAFMSIITMLNPIGIMPTYISMTSTLTARESKTVAIRASLVALVTMILFAFTGKLIFHLFGVSVDSLRIVGGIIFFIVGYEMFQSKLPRSKFEPGDELEPVYDQAITPIGIPLICGPGAITSVILLMSESKGLVDKSVLMMAIIIALFITMMVLISAPTIMKFLGNTGKKVLSRMMGLIVMVVSVEIFFTGLKSLLKS